MLKPLLAASCAALLLAACGGDRTQAVVAAASPQTAQPARNFMLFFAYDRATLTPDGQAVVHEAAAAARARPNSRITVAGHPDTAGNSTYNVTLAQQRAEAVRQALISDGVDQAAVAVAAKGEFTVSSRDGMREPKNRRVEIIVQ
jgi:OOP family OmpA-OmpF porin